MGRSSKYLFYSYLALLFWLPIPLGSNRPLWWSLAALAAGLLLLAWVLREGFRYDHIPNPLIQARWPLLILLLFNLWVAVQLLPAGWVPGFLHSPLLRDAYLDAGLGQGWLSADWAATVEMLMRSLSLLFLVLLTLLLVRSERRVKQVLAVLLAAGFLQALYGTIMTLTGTEYGFFEPKVYARGLATGSYINRNHYANLLVLSLSAGIGLMICRMGLRGAPNWKARLRSFLQALLGGKMLVRSALVFIVIALVLTHSRMGNMAFFASLLVTSGLALLLMRRPVSRPLLVLVVSLLVIDIFLVGAWFGVEQVVERIQATVQVEQDQWVVKSGNRKDVSRETLAIAGNAPLLGTGGGTFYTVYPHWRAGDQLFMDHAHNDYLQFLAEYGWAGGLLLAAFVCVVVFRLLQKLRQPDDLAGFGVAFGSTMAVCAMLIHASVDFNLQIHANAAWFVVLCILSFRANKPGGERHAA